MTASAWQHTGRMSVCVCVCKEEPMHTKASRGESYLFWDDGTTAGHTEAHAAFIIYLTSPAGAPSTVFGGAPH